MNTKSLNSSDIRYLKLLLKKSKELILTKEPPFTSLITLNDELIASSTNKVVTHKDVTLHAEICAMKESQLKLNQYTLEGCTLYSICEPCPMCSFVARELHISRVVYGISSPNMGGHTKWDILGDIKLQKLPKYSHCPEITGNVMPKEVYDVFKLANFHYMFADLKDY